MRQVTPSGTITDTNAPSSGGGAGTPAASVVSETSFGLSSAVGSSTDYARADHAHGTPATPTKSDVGLSNVDNTSDATKNAAAATLTNKTLTSPVINSPTGLAKADVGLSNVDNTSDTNKPVSTAQQAALDAKVQMLVTGWTTGIGASTTLYFSPGISVNGSGTETQRQTRMPACTLTQLRVHVGSAQSATGALVITVRKNGSATSMTITVTMGAAANTDFDDTAHTVSVAAGDKISIEAVQGLGTGAANVTIALVYR